MTQSLGFWIIFLSMSSALAAVDSVSVLTVNSSVRGIFICFLHLRASPGAMPGASLSAVFGHVSQELADADKLVAQCTQRARLEVKYLLLWRTTSIAQST